jgi:hypothetical protein
MASSLILLVEDSPGDVRLMKESTTAPMTLG